MDHRTFAGRIMTVAVLLALTALSGCGSSGPKHVISYDVIESNLSGSGVDNVPSSELQYGYTLHDQQGAGDGDELFDAVLPLHKELTTHGDFWEIFIIVDALEVPTGTDPDDLPTVQCQVSIDGAVVMTKTNQGAVTCDLNQADLQKLGV